MFHYSSPSHQLGALGPHIRWTGGRELLIGWWTKGWDFSSNLAPQGWLRFPFGGREALGLVSRTSVWQAQPLKSLGHCTLLLLSQAHSAWVRCYPSPTSLFCPGSSGVMGSFSLTSAQCTCTHRLQFLPGLPQLPESAPAATGEERSAPPSS